MLFDTPVSSHDTRANLHVGYLAHHPRQRQTIATVTLFVLLFKYAHIRDIITHLACRVMARVPVRSPFYPKSRGGSHMRRAFAPELDGQSDRMLSGSQRVQLS